MGKYETWKREKRNKILMRAYQILRGMVEAEPVNVRRVEELYLEGRRYLRGRWK